MSINKRFDRSAPEADFIRFHQCRSRARSTEAFGVHACGWYTHAIREHRTMNGTTYEAIVEDGCVVLPEHAHIPDNTRVYVVVPASNDAERVRMTSPRLVHREEVGGFTMQVEREADDARL